MSRRRRPVSPAAAAEPLTAAAATCPVCLSVLVRPVTMPCRHTLCSPCFDATVEQAALSCPLCRTRISVWLRKARRAGSLVDEPLWRRLQSEFPDKVQARLEGRDADFSEEDLEPVVGPLLSAPGEIRREFQEQLEAVRDEEQERRSRAERASRELIDRLQQETAEETRRRQEQERGDAEMARGVMQEEERFVLPSRPAGPGGDRPRVAGGAGGRPPRPASSSTPIRGPMDVYLGQMTPRVGGKRPVSPEYPLPADYPDPGPSLDATPSPTGSCKENSDPAAVGARCGSVQSSESTDSIGAELRHFKPIRAAPRTPPRRRPDGVLGAPPVVQAAARVLVRRLARAGRQEQRDRPRPARTVGGSGEGRVAGKRPAEEQADGGTPAKRLQPPAETEVDPDEPPFLTPPLPPQEPRDSEELEPQELQLELDLDSPELLEQQREAERLIALELADRRLAERLQRELNTVPPVDRSKGSADAYSLRGVDCGQPGPSGRHSQRRAAGGRRPPARRDRAQLSIQESLDRSSRVGRTGR